MHQRDSVWVLFLFLSAGHQSYCAPGPRAGSALLELGRGSSSEGSRADGQIWNPWPLQCCAWGWSAEIRKDCCGCSLLLRMMVNILRTMPRSSSGGTAGFQVVRWSMMPLKREAISLLGNSGLRQVLRACPELLSCTTCPLCAPVIPVTASAAEQKPLNSFSGAKCCCLSLSSKAELCYFSSVV